jgi:phenylalanyl-tRNA synthetase beta subunit
MALSLIFRAKDRTLTDREVNEAMAEITSGLKYKFGAAQR